MRKFAVSFLGAAVILAGGVVRAHAAPTKCAATGLLEHCEAWSDRGGALVDGQNASAAIAETPDGSRVVTAGYAPGSASAHDLLIAATDAATGGRRWTATYDGPSAGDDQGVALAISPDGSKAFVT